MPIDRDSVVAHGVRYTGQVEEEDKTDKGDETIDRSSYSFSFATRL